MNKEERIARYGDAAYAGVLAQSRAWKKAHPEESKAAAKKWRDGHLEHAKAINKKYKEEHLEQAIANNKKYREDNPEKAAANNREKSRKGGKHYDKQLKDMRTGIPGEKNKIRDTHGKQYKQYKAIIAPDSQLHHEWIPDTSDYRGVALVETEQHMHGFVDVIEILAGKITLLTEEEVKAGRKKDEKENI